MNLLNGGLSAFLLAFCWAFLKCPEERNTHPVLVQLLPIVAATFAFAILG